MKQMAIVLVLVLLCFNGSLAIKYVSMKSKPCIFKPMLIHLNPDELY